MGAYTELVDFTFTANETSRTFSGLSITKDDFIKVVINGTTGQMKLFPNNETTDTNYHVQTLQAEGSGVVALRSNLQRIAIAGSNTTTTAIAYCKLSENDRFNIFANNTVFDNSSIRVRFDYSTSSGATFTSGITSLTLQAENTNGLGTGSRIQIYRLDAEKVADITVASNTTQVDISNLSIDKDSEYLLVSDVVQATSDFTDLRLMLNDNTTDTNYHSQRIRGTATTADAARGNNAKMAELPGINQTTLQYAHIKLSNIGAFTFQNYSLQGVGTTSPNIQNWFGSSTSESITSITKLNIKSNVTNGIKAGSRFILYKLYE